MQVKGSVSAGRAMMAVLGALAAVAVAQGASGNSSRVHISNFGRVDDRLYRGAQPSGHDYKDLASMGIKTVIDLQADGVRDEANQVRNAGMKFYRIPMSDHSRPSNGAVQQFLQLVNDPTNQPVFIHCHGGRHRTGAMTAVYRMNNYGWNANQAYSEMKQYEFDSGIGHGALKDFVYSYYSVLAQNKAAAQKEVAQKREAGAATEPAKSGQAVNSSEAVKSSEPVKSSETGKSIEAARSTEAVKSSETGKSTEPAKSYDAGKSSEAGKSLKQ